MIPPPLQTAAAALFWVCVALVIYAYVGYPVVVWALARLFGGRTRAAGHPEPQSPADLPFVSLLIAAYNEEAVIGDRLRNGLAMDYPRDRFEIVVGSDGSSDATCDIVRGFADQGVRLLDYRDRRGKSSVLNSAMAEVRGDVVLLSDANTDIDPAAARNLVRWFADSHVGTVCGKLVLTDPSTGGNADGLYWKYETFLKKCEGRLGALLGSNGAIYAIRRELYVPIPGNTIVDDFVIPLLAKLRHGRAIVYDCDSVAREETAPDVASEFHRRARIGAGGFQAIGILWRLLDPRQGWTAFTFLSHKVLRWLCPFFLIGALAANLLLLGRPFYRLALAAHGAFYLLAVASAYVPGRSPLFKPLRLVTMFTSMNAALLVGFFRWLRGGQKGTWKRTARLAEGAAAAERAAAGAA
jgi:cellulose synthase/poly-beta-1,6-N-acetylglucosamine synthase-like glycosyltransferase